MLESERVKAITHRFGSARAKDDKYASASALQPGQAAQDAHAAEPSPAGLTLGADVGLIELLNMSFETMSSLIARYRMAANPPDVLVTVPVSAVRTLDFHRAAEMIEIGRRLTTEALSTAPDTRDPAE